MEKAEPTPDGYWRGHLRSIPLPPLSPNGQGRAYMDPGKIHLLQIILRNFATAYKKYLDAEGLPENYHNKVAFYALAETLVEQEPMPDHEIQQCLKEQLSEIKLKAAEELLDSVDLLVMEASHEDAETRRATW